MRKDNRPVHAKIYAMLKKFTIVLLFFSLQLTLQAQEKATVTNGINLENIAYPFPVSYLQRIIQGETVQLAYMDVKPARPNGKTVLLLHGKNFNGAYWEQTATDLQKNGYRVIIPDQLGFGKSSKPYRIQYSFQLLARQTKAILDSLAISKLAVLGHSMGGMLAARFALMYPSVTEKLILENPIGLEDWKLYVPYQSVEDWYAEELKQDRETIKNYQLASYYDNKWKPAYDKWVDMLAGWTTNIDYPRIAWNSALLYDMIFTQPVCYEFEKITAPTLLIIGQRDRTALGKNKAPENTRGQLGNYPLLGRETAGKIRNSTLVELANTGHLPHIESYDQFIQPVLAFLNK